MNIAACDLCGFMHVCRDTTTCQSSMDDNGYPVCVTTGYAIPYLSKCNGEYVDTVGPDIVDASKKNVDKAHYAENIGPVILAQIMEIMVGSKWEHCANVETGKQIARRKATLFRYLKNFKMQNRGKIPNMAVAVCYMVNSSNNWRNLWLVSEEDRLNLCTWCAAQIIKHIMLLRSVSPEIVSTSRLRNITVGLLYQMRSGVIMHGVVLLPKSIHLCRVLPMEIFLESVFGIRSKCITETENIIKVSCLLQCSRVSRHRKNHVLTFYHAFESRKL